MCQEALRQVQVAFEELLTCMAPGRKRDDVAQRVQMLVAELSDGRLPQPVQECVQAVARAASVGDRREASRLCATLVSQHWEEHRVWLLGLQRLLAQPQ